MTRRLSGQRPALALITLALLASSAQADDKAGREREALRRAQQSLRETLAERDALAGEKAGLQQARDKAEEALKETASRVRGAEARAQATRVRLDQAEAALKAKEEALVAAQQREAALQAQLQQTQAALQGQQRTASTVSAMLAERTKENQLLLQQNKTLYRIGLDLVDVVRTQSPSAWLKARDGLLGFKRVEADNLAEGFRTLLDEARYNPAAQTAAAPAAGGQP